MNIIELVAVTKEYPEKSTLFIEGILKIDGNDFHPELVLDIKELVKSLQCAEEFYIFTCGCGESLCAGISDGIDIEHTSDAVIWRFYEPISASDYEDLDDEEWENIKRPAEYVFDPDQYIESITSGLYEMKGLVASSSKSIELAIYDLKIKDFLELDPQVFSTRLDSQEKHLVAKQIEVDAYQDWISAGGMNFRWDELNLPPALFDAYKKWKNLRIFPTLEEDLPAYRIYLEEGRMLCKALKQYLGCKSKVKFKYHPPQIYNAFAWEIIEEIR